MGVPPNQSTVSYVCQLARSVHLFSGFCKKKIYRVFIEFSHSEIPQCKNDKDLLSLGLQHMNFWKNITADLDSSWSWKFERAIRRIQVNEPFNEKSSFNDRSIPVYLSVYVSMYVSISLSIYLSTPPPSPLTRKMTTAQVVETSVI